MIYLDDDIIASARERTAVLLRRITTEKQKGKVTYPSLITKLRKWFKGR